MFAQCFYRFICCLHFFLSFYGFLRQLHHVFPRANGNFYKLFYFILPFCGLCARRYFFLKKVEVATIAAVAKRFRARKTHFAQSAVGHVVDVAKQSAQLGATVFHASGMPQAVCYRHVEVVLAVRLRAFLQVGFAHVVEKNFAVYAVKPGDARRSRTHSINIVYQCFARLSIASKAFVRQTTLFTEACDDNNNRAIKGNGK